ncbi:hypothetical protein SAMN05444354_1462 [Stigmatella aurantiaca]|uniref:Uncharacterized protein n=1 Tax=Stigmatella aurantiaca TaxID=41 RepID=A0A1H8G0E8_STIAU|nr:hypothetical protein [Stigmatella aurantiaca]SEN37240.1 hypothetical protein SAMN05444354_1462 [Stigmatella aurantiaca]
MSDSAEFPFKLDDFIATMTRLLIERGDRYAVGVLAYGTTKVRCEPEYDFGKWHYPWYLTTRVKPAVYGRLSPEQLKETEAVLLRTAEEVFGDEHSDSRIAGFSLSAAVEEHRDWQQAARGILRGQGISNQGRVRSDNPAMLEHDGLFFRSRPEVNFYEACKEASLVCAPLPVFLRPGGTAPFRIEPDMLILRNKMVIQVEIDGRSFHQERAVEAQARTLAMHREGVEVFHIDAADCATIEKARVALRSMLQHFRLDLPRVG